MIIEKIVKTEMKIRVCDFCKKESKSYQLSVKECQICGIDVCNICGLQANLYEDLSSPTFNEDYPGIVCEICWKIGKRYRLRIEEVRKQAEEEELNLFEAWRKLSKDN